MKQSFYLKGAKKSILFMIYITELIIISATSQDHSGVCGRHYFWTAGPDR